MRTVSELARKKATIKGDNGVEDDVLDVVAAQNGATIGMVIAMKSYLHSEEYIKTAITTMVSAGKLIQDGERLALP